MSASLVGLVRQTFLRCGLSIERARFPEDRPVDVLDLLVRQRIAVNPGFVVVQIGANDGKSGDPINRFVETYHPRGVLVEPMPDAFRRLRENYAHVPSIACENCAIATRDGEARLFYVRHDPSLPEYVRQLASFDRRVILKQRRTVPQIERYIETMTVPAMTLTSLLDKHTLRSIDLLQLDTEGFDFEIIKMLMATPIRPEIINFESTHLSRDDKHACAALLAREGFRYVTIGRDTIAHRVA